MNGSSATSATNATENGATYACCTSRHSPVDPQAANVAETGAHRGIYLRAAVGCPLTRNPDAANANGCK